MNETGNFSLHPNVMGVHLELWGSGVAYYKGGFAQLQLQINR